MIRPRRPGPTLTILLGGLAAVAAGAFVAANVFAPVEVEIERPPVVGIGTLTAAQEGAVVSIQGRVVSQKAVQHGTGRIVLEDKTGWVYVSFVDAEGLHNYEIGSTCRVSGIVVSVGETISIVPRSASDIAVLDHTSVTIADNESERDSNTDDVDVDSVSADNGDVSRAAGSATQRLGEYTVVIASPEDETEAYRIAAPFRPEAGWVGVVPAEIRGRRHYRVLVGRYRTESEAARTAEELQNQGALGAWVLELEAGL